MTEKRFTIFKKLENCNIEGDVIDSYIKDLVEQGKSVGWVTVGILDNGKPMTYKDCVNLLNENEQLKKVAKCELVANHRGEMVSFADSLIHDFCDNKAIEMWEKFKEEKWEEYKYKIGFSQ